MKKAIFFLLLVSASFLSKAQVDSSKINQTVTLSEAQVCYIKNCLGNNGDVAYVRFYKQAADQIDTVYNASKPITLTVTSDFVLTCYVAISNVAERLGNPINDAISAALLPQLTNPWLLGKLQAVGLQTYTERATKIQAGFNYLKQIK